MTQTTTEVTPGAATTTTTQATTTATQATTTATQDWHTGITDPEMTGYIQNRGLRGKPLLDAFLATAAAHRTAESKLGTPSDRLVTIPTVGDTAAERAFWVRFGAPEAPEGYVFEGMNEEAAPGLTEALRSTVHALNMPKDMAAGVAKGITKFISDTLASDAATVAAETKAQQEALEVDWGGKDTPKFKANMAIADRAAAAIGISGEVMAKLRDGLGGAAVAKMFRDLGTKLGEARYIENGNNGGSELMTREQAVARRFDLTGIDNQGRLTGKGDKDWMAKLQKGDAEAKREWSALLRLIAG